MIKPGKDASTGVAIADARVGHERGEDVDAIEGKWSSGTESAASSSDVEIYWTEIITAAAMCR
jgi:hypothetical protein